MKPACSSCGLGFVVVASLASMAVSQSGYTIRKLTVPGLDHGLAYAISTDGRVAGAMFDSSGVLHPVVWHNAVGRELPTAAAGFDGLALALASEGRVVGSAATATSTTAACSWLPDGAGSYSQIDYGVGGTASGFGIGGLRASPQADLAVGFVDDGLFVRAAAWTGAASAPTFQLLPQPPAMLASEALAAANGGAVFGYVADFGDTYPARWTVDGATPTLTLLPTLGDTGIVRAVNCGGYAVGSSRSPITGDVHFVGWDGDNLINLGGLPGHSCEAAAVNCNRAVVGWAKPVFGTPELAVIYSDRRGMRDLNSMLPPDSGWQLQRALGINDAGQIVGMGILNGFREPFLMTPTKLQLQAPQPGSAGATNTIQVGNADPASVVVFCASFLAGETLIPNQLEGLDILRPLLFAVAVADQRGVAAALLPPTPQFANTRVLLQAYDITNYRASNAIAHIF